MCLGKWVIFGGILKRQNKQGRNGGNQINKGEWVNKTILNIWHARKSVI
jgi:hypothetical protein